MSRSQVAQSQRTQNNPLDLGTFSSTAIRRLRGSLGPKNQVVGRADTRSQSNGGFGGGSYNHWFQINLTSPAWIIATKGSPRPKYIQVSAYDLNTTPIEGEPIFDADSIRTGPDNNVFIPYLNTVMSAQSILYNQFSTTRLDRGDDRYYPLNAGSYLLCVSTTRNEPLDYEVALVVEFPPTGGLFELEDGDGSLMIAETSNTSAVIANPVNANVVIPPNSGAFSNTICQINNGVTVTVSTNSTWLIGFPLPNNSPNYAFVLEPAPGYFDTVHDHSLGEWKSIWSSTHQDTEPFPEILVPLTNRP